MTAPSAADLAALTEQERKWLLAMPSWSEGMNGVAISRKYDALVARCNELERERAELEIDRNDWKRISNEAEMRAETAERINGFVLRRDARVAELEAALSWALDVLEITLGRLDTLDRGPSDAHFAVRKAGLEKARATLQSHDNRIG